MNDFQEKNKRCLIKLIIIEKKRNKLNNDIVFTLKETLFIINMPFVFN